MPQPPQHIPPSSTLSMDLPFSLRELDHALGSMHPRKAPGDDGITTALMQAIAHDPKIMCSVVLDKDVPSQGSYSMSFINDVLDGVAPISVQASHRSITPRGLMFADDIAIIAPSHEAYVPLWVPC
ncbi:hypothetical protein BASA83_007036 [Batrachochytrium salamandrivorans]|nr:hypothetical protein BASA83_007036 [Batrachochytrium salamandrivorans]